MAIRGSWVQGILCVAGMLTLAAPVAAEPVLLGLKPRTAAASAQWTSGMSALGRNDLKAARTLFDASLTLEPNGIAPRVGLAEIALKQGDAAAADALIRDAVRLSPAPADVQYVWGTFLHKYGRPAAAEAVLTQAVTATPRHAPSRVALADLYLTALGKPADAARHYQAAIDVDRQHAGAQYGLGLALVRLGRSVDAERALKRASALDPRNPLAHQATGALYLAQRRWQDASAAFTMAIQSFPKFAQAYVDRGTARAAVGDDAGALSDFQAAITHAPRHAAAHLQLGALHQRRQEWARAEATYLTATRVAPESATAFNNLAWMAAERRVRLDEALNWARTAVKLEPKQVAHQVTLAWVHRARKEPALGIKVLEQAAGSSAPGDVRALYYLGVLQHESGDRVAARVSLTRALKIEPTMQQAEQARRLLAQGS